MHTSRKVLATVAATLALLVGAGSALADDGQGDKRQAFRDAIATKLGVTPEQLQAAFAAVLVEKIDAAVTSGKLSADKAAKLKQAIAEGKLGRFGAFGKLRLGFQRHAKAFVKRHSALRVAIDYLGTDLPTLRNELTQGKSLADVANATPGKSSAGLVDAILAKVDERLARAVEKGRLTDARKQELLVKAKERIEKLVAKQFTAKSS